ncbi:homocysteine-responsive endoplasmic reticulum-resident ubiquitin-like domain member 2 protein isoform X2 [Synchiropus splendidus]|uniref:homocysteine-responsive endoplasmic reticulum-resident ubiquitin-like domain member 2 protein isoform X2 n=1 Tax=Synchiropus splendidus TaxID=270530 RepID=UPI00237E765C|nr:homocysteine-responsive endoplasmic reticulum-resident ubiquitin-like domain member 2 protein isoform X2 [Synchiropus splendidus]
MEAGPADSPVTLVIKAPNQKYEDQTINCFLNWTVERLKSHISNVYPSKPRARDQRLVYSGRLLQDHLRLREVLRKDEFHMLHLVCSAPPTSSETHSSDSNISDSVASVSAHENQASSSASSVPAGYDGLRSRGAAPQSDPQNLAAAPQWPDGGPGPLYMQGQLLWWQQVYARHYYLQYQAAVAASRTPPAGFVAPPTSTPHRPPPPNEGNPAPDPLPDNPPANPNIQMNAQGGAVLNEDELNRDWLDWLYTVSRASVLLSIVYFYSSFSRFIMVVGAMLLVYLHQVGWFPFRPEQNLGGGDAAEAAREAQPQQDLQEMERLMDDGVDDDSSSEEGGAVADAAPETGFITAAWTFVSTFFTSLIPEGRPQAAN